MHLKDFVNLIQNYYSSLIFGLLHQKKELVRNANLLLKNFFLKNHNVLIQTANVKNKKRGEVSPLKRSVTIGVLNMECLLQNRQPEDAHKELLTFFHLSSLEDMRQSDYRHAVFSVMKRMLLTSGKTSENTQVSPQYAAAIDGLLNFWNHSSDFTKSDIQNYVQNKCGLSLQEGISSDSGGGIPY